MGISTTPLVSGQEITEYIPQRAPIVMVDTFFGVDGGCSVSGLTVLPDNIFVEDGALNESGITEHIAQSCALRVGYLCKCEGIPIPLGFIAAIKNMEFYIRPVVGDEIRTFVKIEQEVFDLTFVSAEVKRGDELVAKGEMKIFLKK